MKGQLSIIAIGILGVFATSTVILAPAIASTAEEFLNIINAEVFVNDGLDAEIEAGEDIPEDGSGGAAGYGILTSEGLDAVIVSTTHGGVYDSEEQDDASDPVWHNHLVSLESGSDECGDDLKVDGLTFESPGVVNIDSEIAQLKGVPTEGFEATNVAVPAFDEANIVFGPVIELEPGTDIQDVVSFKLAPISDNGDPIEAVCVTNIESAENVDILEKEMNGFDEDEDDDNDEDEDDDEDL